jgi:uncharacterized membrane-anchored protein
VRTSAADNLGVSLVVTTVGFSIVLAAVFAIWFAFERTLSIHTIYTTRREGFYWLAVLFTFALGTAAGDLTAERLNLGYLVSLLLFAGLIAAVAGAHYFLDLNAIAAFWIAYILTRPLGASLGDYLSQPTADGGRGLGTTTTRQEATPTAPSRRGTTRWTQSRRPSTVPTSTRSSSPPSPPASPAGSTPTYPTASPTSGSR